MINQIVSNTESADSIIHKVEQIGCKPNHQKRVVYQQAYVMILLTSFLQKYEAVSDDHAH